MESENIQNEALRLEKLLQDSISGDYSHEKYKIISEIVNFIKSHIEDLQQLTCDEVIFIIGPTGAGKSTLMNYLSKEDNLLVSKFGKLCARDSIADIGEGTTGSTTLFPNTWKHDDIGVFIDCAGEFDTRGVLIEAINSKVKTLIANNVKSAKILFVIPQTSFSAEGAYGKIFKEALDKNAKFINDISYFRDNIVLVISHASRNIDTHENIGILLHNVLEHSSLSHFTDTVKHVIEQKNMITFCKPSDEASPGSLYEPPAWNTDERKEIIQKITALNFITIPEKDFFNVSSSLEVKEQMEKALTIVKKKAGHILMDAIKEVITPKLNIYATELMYFAAFLKQLVTERISCSLEQYIRFLQYNNFLAISPDPGVISKLTNELLYLESFTNDQQNCREKGGRYNWNNLSGISYLVHDIHEEVSVIINKSSELFTQFGSYDNLIVNGGFSESVSVKCLFKELQDNHKEKCNVESLRYHTNSKYYYDNQMKEFDHMESKSYTRTETYSESEPYTKTNYNSKDVPYTVKETITVEEPAKVRTVFAHALTLGITYVGKYLFTGDPKLYNTVKREIQKTEYRRELVEKEETDYKVVAKTKEVTDHRNEPVLKNVNRREFNESEFKKDLKQLDDINTKLRENIMKILAKMKLTNKTLEIELCEDAVNKVEMNISKNKEHTQNQFSIASKDLYEEWKFLEYEALFLKKPDMSININNMRELLA